MELLGTKPASLRKYAKKYGIEVHEGSTATQLASLVGRHYARHLDVTEDEVISRFVKFTHNYQEEMQQKRVRREKESRRRVARSTFGSRQYDSDTDSNEQPKLYCICNRPSFGEMVGCDDDDCKIEWFHVGCVDVSPDALSTGAKWYCPTCRAKRADERATDSARTRAKRKFTTSTQEPDDVSFTDPRNLRRSATGSSSASKPAGSSRKRTASNSSAGSSNKKVGNFSNIVATSSNKKPNNNSNNNSKKRHHHVKNLEANMIHHIEERKELEVEPVNPSLRPGSASSSTSGSTSAIQDGDTISPTGSTKGGVTYAAMIGYALEGLDSQTGTFREICDRIEERFADNLNWKPESENRRTPVWKSSVRKILISHNRFRRLEPADPGQTHLFAFR